MCELRLECRHTHLYPGHRGSVHGRLPVARGAEGATCQVEFSDGSMALGALEVRSDTEAVLETGPYITAAGTPIPPKRWRIEVSRGADGLRHFKVRTKLGTPEPGAG